MENPIYRLMHLGLPQNVWGNTALSRASGGGHAEIAKVLLEHGAYVDYRNKVHLFIIFDNIADSE